MTKHTFLTLDGLRGVAALSVVAMHYREPFGLDFASNAHLAVDLFFIMSGFVIAHAYEAKVLAGLPFGRFALVRLIRLYPMYLAGSMITIVGVGAGLLAGMSFERWNWWSLARSAGLALFMLPTPSSDGELYPLNYPAWSLFYELIANLVFALLLARRSTSFVAVVALTSGAALTIIVLNGNPINTGSAWGAVGTSLLRVMFGFSIGQWMYRTASAVQRGPVIASWLILSAVAILLALPVESRVFAAVMPLIVLPFVVRAAINTEPHPAHVRFYRFLGAISYPIYVIHIPILYFGRRVFERLSGVPVEHVPLVVFAPALTALVLAWAADRYFDCPARKWLLARWIRRS